MLAKEQRIVISVIFGFFAVLGSICVYGFAIGGEYISFKYITYCLVTSFVMVSSVFLFILGKDEFKEIFAKELFILIVILVAVIQFIGYQPLNKFTSADTGIEYEVEIVRGFGPKDSIVHFMDKDGIERSIDKTLDISYMFLSDGELSPETGGRMIVREAIGGFNCKYFEIVKVTYEPYF